MATDTSTATEFAAHRRAYKGNLLNRSKLFLELQAKGEGHMQSPCDRRAWKRLGALKDPFMLPGSVFRSMHYSWKLITIPRSRDESRLCSFRSATMLFTPKCEAVALLNQATNALLAVQWTFNKQDGFFWGKIVPLEIDFRLLKSALQRKFTLVAWKRSGLEQFPAYWSRLNSVNSV